MFLKRPYYLYQGTSNVVVFLVSYTENYMTQKQSVKRLLFGNKTTSGFPNVFFLNFSDFGLIFPSVSASETSEIC
jgi:hypothetical protein